MAKRQIDITDIYPPIIVRWFTEQDELDSEQELVLEQFYNDMSPETEALLDTFQKQLEFDTDQEKNGSQFFQIPT